MRQIKLDLDTLAVESFEPGSEEPASVASTTYDASFQWCGTTSGGEYFCYHACDPASNPGC
jgi:hypothetical protein